jgi:hypothetical protein
MDLLRLQEHEGHPGALRDPVMLPVKSNGVADELVFEGSNEGSSSAEFDRREKRHCLKVAKAHDSEVCALWAQRIMEGSAPPDSLSSGITGSAPLCA